MRSLITFMSISFMIACNAYSQQLIKDYPNFQQILELCKFGYGIIQKDDFKLSDQKKSDSTFMHACFEKIDIVPSLIFPMVEINMGELRKNLRSSKVTDSINVKGKYLVPIESEGVVCGCVFLRKVADTKYELIGLGQAYEVSEKLLQLAKEIMKNNSSDQLIVLADSVDISKLIVVSKDGIERLFDLQAETSTFRKSLDIPTYKTNLRDLADQNKRFYGGDL